MSFDYSFLMSIFLFHMLKRYTCHRVIFYYCQSIYELYECKRYLSNGLNDNSIENDGGRFLLNQKQGTAKPHSVATGKFSSKFTAEVEVMKFAVEMLLIEKNKEKYIAPFNDAKSVVSILMIEKYSTELTELRKNILSVPCQNSKVV